MLEEEICKLFQNQSDVNAKTYSIIKHLKELVFKLYEMDKDQNDQFKEMLDIIKLLAYKSTLLTNNCMLLKEEIDQLKKELDQLKGQGK